MQQWSPQLPAKAVSQSCGSPCQGRDRKGSERPTAKPADQLRHQDRAAENTDIAARHQGGKGLRPRLDGGSCLIVQRHRVPALLVMVAMRGDQGRQMKNAGRKYAGAAPKDKKGDKSKAII